MAEVDCESVDQIEIEISEGQLQTLRETASVVTRALADVGEAHLAEQDLRRRHEQAKKILQAAELGAKQALQMRDATHRTLFAVLELQDGDWDLDLKNGKLVRTDGKP